MKASRILMCAGLCGVLSTGAAFAQVPEPAAETPASVPAQFQLKKGAKMQIVDLKTPGNVKVCVDNTGLAAGVKVAYDGKDEVIDQGNCIQVEARNVAVHPTDNLPQGMVVTGVYTID